MIEKGVIEDGSDASDIRGVGSDVGRVTLLNTAGSCESGLPIPITMNTRQTRSLTGDTKAGMGSLGKPRKREGILGRW